MEEIIDGFPSQRGNAIPQELKSEPKLTSMNAWKGRSLASLGMTKL
jgi:hypothetical protein